MEVRDNLIVIGQVEYDALIKRIQYSEYKSECAIQMNKDLQDKVFPPVYDADGCEDAGVTRKAVGTNDNVTISKEVFSEISELLGLADVITDDILHLGLKDNTLKFADELSGNAWSNELVELLRQQDPEKWKK